MASTSTKIFRIEFNACTHEIFQNDFDDKSNEIFAQRIYSCVKSRDWDIGESIECFYFKVDKLTEIIEQEVAKWNGTYVPDEIVQQVLPFINALMPETDPDFFNFNVCCEEDLMNMKVYNDILDDYEQSLFPDNDYKFLLIKPSVMAERLPL